MIVRRQKSKNCVTKNMAKTSLKRNMVSATNMIPTTFNEKDTKAIMKACKVHYVSPLAAIQAAMITILTEKQYISGEIEFTATVDLRRYYPACKANDKYQQVANYATLAPCEITSGGSSIGRSRRTPPPLIGENIAFSCIFLIK